MRVFGLGALELVILLGVTAIGVIPAIGVFWIARRAGYDTGLSLLWALGYVLPGVSWFIPLALGLAPWPRDAHPAVIPPPPPHATAP